MVFYQCPRCHYETKYKNDLRKHYNRKTVCKTLFERKPIKNCKEDLEKKDIHTSLREENERLKKQLAAKVTGMNNSHNTTNNTTNNTNNTNSHNTNNINININSYKNTDYSFILDKAQEYIKDNGEMDMKKFVKLLHFNEEHPENHNIYMTDSRHKKLMIYDGIKFNQRGNGNLGIEKFMKSLHSKTRQNIDDNSFEELINEYNQGNLMEKKKIRDDFYDILYNERDTVLNTHRDVDTLE